MGGEAGNVVGEAGMDGEQDEWAGEHNPALCAVRSARISNVFYLGRGEN